MSQTVKDKRNNVVDSRGVQLLKGLFKLIQKADQRMRLSTVLAAMLCQVYGVETFGNIHTVSTSAQNRRLTLSNIDSLT